MRPALHARCKGAVGTRARMNMICNRSWKGEHMKQTIQKATMDRLTNRNVCNLPSQFMHCASFCWGNWISESSASWLLLVCQAMLPKLLPLLNSMK